MDSRLFPGSRTDGALEVILGVWAMPRTLTYLAEGYPGFKAMNAAASRIFKDPVVGEDRKPPSNVAL